MDIQKLAISGPPQLLSLKTVKDHYVSCEYWLSHVCSVV